MELSKKQLEQLLTTLEGTGVSEFEYKDQKYSLRLKFGNADHVSAFAAASSIRAPTAESATVATAIPATSAPPSEDTEEQGIGFVTSPFVGTFYRAPSPEAEPFVEVGGNVSKGQTLCIVEAMKLMNEIESEFAGVVVDVLAENGSSVEYGQRLFKIKKA